MWKYDKERFNMHNFYFCIEEKHTVLKYVQIWQGEI